MVPNPFCFRSQGRISLSMTLVNSANVLGFNLTVTWRANMSTSLDRWGRKWVVLCVGFLRIQLKRQRQRGEQNQSDDARPCFGIHFLPPRG